jgi:Bacterial Ig-like domain
MKRILVLLSVVIGMGVLFLVPVPMALAQGSPSDPRAVFIEGNVPPGDCQVGGQLIPESSLTFSISGAGRVLTITAVDAGYTVQSVYVKGSDDTNLYQPGQRGLPTNPPYVNLISPLDIVGQLPVISHWFACGIVPEVDTTLPTVTDTTPDGTASKTDTVTATFSEEVQNVTTDTFILERNIAVKKTDPPKYVLVDATVEPSTDGKSAVLTPVEDLPKGTYRATITTDVTDMADNALEDPVVWTFTVAK